MKNIILILFFVSIHSIAGELAYVNYLKHFSAIFSHPTISEADYSKLSSYELNPGLFINFDKSPPNSFGDNDKQNTNVIFNGEVSRKYFVKFITSGLINDGYLNVTSKKVFKDKVGDYSFEAKIKGEQLVILENMLISAPDGMTAEISCSYAFGSINKDLIKLTDVVCAG